MNSSVFGPSTWQSMFFIAAGYDLNETAKSVKDPKYRQYFKSIGDVLPCRYCRESYEKFYDSMDIQQYLDMPSCGLIRFVYDLKNMVNAKLIAQEDQAFEKEYYKLLETKSPNDPDVTKALEDLASRIFYTKPPPPFEDVVADVLKHRVKCSSALKTCRAPLNNGRNDGFPKVPSMPQLPTNADSDAALYRTGGKRLTSRRRKHHVPV